MSSIKEDRGLTSETGRNDERKETSWWWSRDKVLYTCLVVYFVRYTRLLSQPGPHPQWPIACSLLALSSNSMSLSQSYLHLEFSDLTTYFLIYLYLFLVNVRWQVQSDPVRRYHIHTPVSLFEIGVFLYPVSMALAASSGGDRILAQVSFP